MKIQVQVEIKINSGTALLLFIASFFGLIWMTQHHEPVERVFAVAIAALTGAFSGYLLKRNADNKNANELELGKLAAANGAPK